VVFFLSDSLLSPALPVPSPPIPFPPMPFPAFPFRTTPSPSPFLSLSYTVKWLGGALWALPAGPGELGCQTQFGVFYIRWRCMGFSWANLCHYITDNKTSVVCLDWTQFFHRLLIIATEDTIFATLCGGRYTSLQVYIHLYISIGA